MTFEILVRPVAPVPVLSKDGKPINPVKQADTAVAEWQGGPGQYTKRKDVYIWPSSSTEPDTPPETDKPTFNFIEVSRTEKTVRVTQPGKPGNYVDVAVTTSITFEGAESCIVFKMNA